MLTSRGPNQGGGAGAACDEVWIRMGEYAILVIGPPSQGVFVVFPVKEAHFYVCSLLFRQLVAHHVGREGLESDGIAEALQPTDQPALHMVAFVPVKALRSQLV